MNTYEVRFVRTLELIVEVRAKDEDAAEREAEKKLAKTPTSAWEEIDTEIEYVECTDKEDDEEDEEETDE